MTGDDATVLIAVFVAVVALAWTIGLIVVAVVAVRFFWLEQHQSDPLAAPVRHTDLDLGFDRLVLAPWPDEVAAQRARARRDAGPRPAA